MTCYKILNYEVEQGKHIANITENLSTLSQLVGKGNNILLEWCEVGQGHLK